MERHGRGIGRQFWGRARFEGEGEPGRYVYVVDDFMRLFSVHDTTGIM